MGACGVAVILYLLQAPDSLDTAISRIHIDSRPLSNSTQGNATLYSKVTLTSFNGHWLKPRFLGPRYMLHLQ